ncbi:MAG: DUF5110 domain-containing protein [Prevotella sp.]|nr:DUF5110 domain-containing protein [Prevotella sp.]
MKRLSVLLAIGAIAMHTMAQESHNVAYQDQQVRFTVITDGTIRLEWQPEGQFTNNASFVAVCRDYPEVDYKVRQTKTAVDITTKKMRLTYKKGTGRLTADNLVIRSLDKRVPFTWKPGMEQQYNLKGTYRTLDGYDGDKYFAWGYTDKEGKPMQLEDGLLARDGWTLIDDSQGLLFDGDVQNTSSTTPWPWVKERSGDEAQDWYFMAYGHDYKAALSDYTVFAGRIPMPPRYAFGYWWSRYWSYSDAEIRELVDDFHNYGLPLDVLVVDMDWHWTEKGKGGWTGYTWNDRLFPDPAKFLAYLKSQNLQITLNLHPADGVPAYEDKYPALAEFLGSDPMSTETIPWQSSDKQFMTGWFEKMLRPLEREGVDFWWLDWQQGLYDSKIPSLSNTWWLNYCVFSDQERNSQRRPMLYHRWGGLGNHRYQIGFSGDSYSTWASLEYQPYFNSTASNVLYGYWSHDLGGHMLGNNQQFDTELYTRWMQLGTYLPIMRSHSTKSAAMSKEPWNLGSKLMPIVSETIRQRYTLAPYIYTCAREAYETGVSLCRPLYYDYPEAEQAYSQRNEYLFGGNLLIAPITKPMQEERSTVQVWLPEGTAWYETATGTLLEGGQTVERNFLIDEYPVYAKAGSIIPTYGRVENLSSNSEQITFVIYPGATQGEGCFYEDNGDDKHYATQYAKTQVTMKQEGQVQTITIGARKGSYEGMPATRDYALRLVGMPVPTAVTVDGLQADFTYEGKDLSVRIGLPGLAPEREHSIEVTYPSDVPQLNDGLTGQFRRIQQRMKDMKFRDAGINYIDGLGQLGSIVQAINYAPDSFSTLIQDFRDNYSRLPELLELQQMKDEDVVWFLKGI